MPGLSAAAVGKSIVLGYAGRVAVGSSDLAIPWGGVTSLIGPNGSGKSTLLMALAGLHPLTAGRLEVLGQAPSDARRRVALVMQATKVNEALPVTVREVVAMGRYASLGMLRPFRSEDRRKVEEAIGRLGLGDLAGRHLSELSGGERQRVFVAQGLAQDHELLLMDEPTTALDLVTAAAISGAIDDEREAGRTVVVTTHDLNEASQSDHVILLSGRVVAEGPPEVALTAETLSEAYSSSVMEVEGRMMVDDAAHRPAQPRHVHFELGAGTHHHED